MKSMCSSFVRDQLGNNIGKESSKKFIGIILQFLKYCKNVKFEKYSDLKINSYIMTI
jgi:hypothetical protein